jgi:hypothetical protein
MAVVALSHHQNHDFTYICLKEALEKELLEIKEVDQHGAVPTLMAINKGSLPILILDGEELVGGKQNRVLNTTILLKEKSKTILPVSCTEQGRWRYTSKKFADSGVAMMATLRGRKTRSVSASLQRKRRYESDQQEIWASINELSRQAAVHSPSSAMRDVMEKKRTQLQDYLQAFSWVEEQKGLLVIVNDRVVGFDFISSTGVMKKLYPKLIESYASEAYFQQTLFRQEKQTGSSPREKMYNQKARDFLEKIKKSPSRRFPSPGHGWDYRFQEEGLAGSALLWRRIIIHTAFFQIPPESKNNRMAGPGQRSRFRL